MHSGGESFFVSVCVLNRELVIERQRQRNKERERERERESERKDEKERERERKCMTLVKMFSQESNDHNFPCFVLESFM